MCRFKLLFQMCFSNCVSVTATIGPQQTLHLLYFSILHNFIVIF